MQRSINVVVADRHPIVLSGVRRMLEPHTDISVVATATDSSDVVDLLSRVPCDVLLTDDVMSAERRGDGLRYLTFLGGRFPEVKIIIFGMTQKPDLCESWAKTGAYSFVSKRAESDQLVSAIRQAIGSS